MFNLKSTKHLNLHAFLAINLVNIKDKQIVLRPLCLQLFRNLKNFNLKILA